MHVRAAENVVFKQIGEELVLLDYTRGMYYGLDAIGARIWELLANHSIDEVVTRLLDEYDVSRDRLENDVARLIDELREKGLVV
jgi:hypothetical protein